ncbi:MAG: hypothetical protein B7Z30_04115 [Rhizobiales bacterium 12-68-15]|nr:MAG: hypothetical protein B7Z30_04115 [Rhizobiales bacterium 12-68-15]
MTEKLTAPDPPDLAEEVFAAVEAKAGLAPWPMIVLGVLAGVYIGMGGLFATVALAGADALPHGVGQVLAGAVFSAGLALVLIAGAELFTGNMLMVGPLAAGRIPLPRVMVALAMVYGANLVGSLLLAALVLAAGVHEAGGGAVGQAALDLGAGKTGNGFLTTLSSGVLANMLVCLAVWLAYAGRTVTQKLAGILLPVAAFVAAGLEHSVANMYLLPYALMVQTLTGQMDAALSLPAILGNLVPATLGNMIGGALVALAYWQAFVRRAGPA